nr:MAG TPA: hypothetical protein [Caudoviricetes sp.]
MLPSWIAARLAKRGYFLQVNHGKPRCYQRPTRPRESPSYRGGPGGNPA